jgi:hypothetical protein
MYRELKIGPAKVDWRVHACMNESVHFWADNDACHTPDDDVNRLLDNGPVASVP